MRPSVLLGIDLGSTRTKVGLITPAGAPIAFARVEQSMDVDPATGRAEQDPEAWWAGLREAIRAALVQAEASGQWPLDIAGICVAGHGPSLTPVDAAGRPTRASITWLDSRSTGELADLEAATGLRGW